MPFSDILNDEIDPESPITTSLMNRLRDNPLVRDLQVFSTPGSFTWTRPEGCNGAIVICVGGGGGGGGNPSFAVGQDGGNSSFGGLVSCGGGAGGGQNIGGAGGSVLTSPTLSIDISGGAGQDGSSTLIFAGGNSAIGVAGSGTRLIVGSDKYGNNGSVGGGGAGCVDGGGTSFPSGGAGATSISLVTGLSSNQNITVGSGGVGGRFTTITSRRSGDGGSGLVAVYSLFDVQAAF